MIGIGIDTGGTCTDAVVYDTVAHNVLSSAKTLTTRQDLKVGILDALRRLDPHEVKKASYISLSTTLATNACVENKGGRAKLIMIGVNPKVVERMKNEYGLPPARDIYFLPGDPAASEPELKIPPWKKFIKDIDEFRKYDSVAIVQINPKFNGGRYEVIAEKIIKKYIGISCVRGYDLYQEINVQKRGATALLNARLLPVVDSFLRAIESSLEEMGIDLPLMIVKSDGSLMSKEYAKKRPVETLLCGPAASVIGAMELAEDKDALIVDMGGTTSDIALIKDRKTVSSISGIRIGRWNTMVKGISMDTFALGGDSGVKYRNGVMYLDRRRMIPLCVLASEYPHIKYELSKLLSRRQCFSYPAHEYFVLAEKPKNTYILSQKKKMLIERLEEGPLSYAEAAAAAGVNPFVFKMRRLEDEGIIMSSGITPTDIMHIYGDYNEYDKEASELGVRYLSMATDLSEKEVCSRVYDMVKSRLFSNLVRIMMKHEAGRELTENEEENLCALTEMIYDKKGQSGKFINMAASTCSTLIGVGGPTGIFLENVAELLDTKANVPCHSGVANAIGAAAGNISCAASVYIEPDMNRKLGYDYCLMGPYGFCGFNDYDEALRVAEEQARKAAGDKAAEQGAIGQISVNVSIDEDYFQVNQSGKSVFVKTEVRAEAVISLI